MRVYLDACCLQRPLDDRSQPRVNLEAEAVLTILGMVENGDLKLISSQALEFEVERNPDSERRGAAKAILKLASETAGLVDEIETEAEAMVEAGFKPLDALHLAFASHAVVEYFCTCPAARPATSVSVLRVQDAQRADRVRDLRGLLLGG